MHMQMTSDNDETSQAAVVVAQKADEHNSLAGHLPKCAASARRQAAEGSKCSACRCDATAGGYRQTRSPSYARE